MGIAGGRKVRIILAILIAATAALILDVLLTGGFHLRIRPVGLKFRCTRIGHPLLILATLAAAWGILSRPDPLGRLRRRVGGNRRAIALAAVVAATAAVPRLSGLDGHSLNSDEILWINRGQRLVYALREREYRRATMHLGHPGVTSAALIGASSVYLGRNVSRLSFNVAGPVTAARLPIALLGTATCLLLYLLGRRRVGDAAAFWGGMLLALYPHHIAVSRVAHLDSTLTLFIMLALLCYLACVDTMRPRWRAASAVFFGLALLTKSPAFLIPPILAAWKAAARLLDRRGRLRFWEWGDLAWLGGGLAIYFCLFTKLWYPPGELHWADFLHYLRWAGPLIRLVDALAARPWLQVAAALYAASLLARAAVPRLRPPRGSGWRELLRPAQPLSAILAALLLLSFVQVFDRPMDNLLLLASKTYHIEELGHMKYWMGRVVLSPPRWYYLFMLLVCSPPITLFFLACGIGRGAGIVARREKGWPAVLMYALAPLLFIAAMSMGRKMGLRYIEPAVPFVCALAGVGVAAAARALGDLRLGEGPAVSRRAAFHALAAVAVGATILPPLRAVAPDYELYHNVLVGGPAGAARFILVGWGTGSKEAADYIRRHAGDGDAVYALGIFSEFRYYWNLEPPPFDLLINRTKPPHVDWLIVPEGHRLRRLEIPVLRFADRLEPAHRISRFGLPFLDIYRVEDAPVADRRSYEAEDLRSDVGRRVDDGAASGGGAVEGVADGGRGTLLYGPYHRFAPGRWRAVFWVKAPGAAADRAIATLSVSGLATRDRIASAAPLGREAGSGEEYRPVTLDFDLDAPRRIQFCVEHDGVAVVRVDRVEVSPR
ncbi:MAG: glycosyltransferase family 39 protein [bacterium]|nr:glycosyltransferase family 39 protein [bacterium]